MKRKKKKINLDRLLIVILIPLVLLSSTVFILNALKKTPILPQPFYIGSYHNLVIVEQGTEHNIIDDIFAFSPVSGDARDKVILPQIDLANPNNTTLSFKLDSQSVDIRYIIHPQNATIDPKGIAPTEITEANKLDVLVNRYYSLPSDYIPDNLVNVNNYLVRKDIQEPLIKLLSDASSNGVSFFITSAYRSYDYQANLFNESVERSGYEETIKYVAYPGRSEHQTGLAVDVLSSDTPYLSEEMGVRPSGQWLQEHAHEYGFIVRYPKDKSSITGYGYEPWHLRYLGVDLATQLKNNGWTYEEYMLYTQNNPSYINGVK